MGKLVVTSTPHIRSEETTKGIMLDVLVALAPAAFMGVLRFGFRSAAVIAVCLASCAAAEFLFEKITKKPVTTGDLSALVTGLLLAMNLPPGVPLWVPAVGGFFAIIIVKQLFGGLGQNFMNPALAARAFLQASYPDKMSAWLLPGKGAFLADAVSGATPLSTLKYNAEGFYPQAGDYMDALFGRIGGSIGETCSLALIFGGAYLLLRRVITWRIPVAYIATFMALSGVLGRDGLFTGYPVYETLLGGVMLGAFFMATDYSSSPVSNGGKIIMGIGCGVLTFIIRRFGGYPEGVCYAILIMNLFTPIIDRFSRPRVFGTGKGGFADV
ncbi:MAG: RnfABCDGE type electron transport complex subunit D [Clostridiales bacterium]|nr:RnfABCDGE type electron transport complex subunit D [Clostridiales bacterium]